MKVFIKNMVCQGTKKFLIQELKRIGYKLKSIDSEEIEFYRELTQMESEQLLISLKKYGLEVNQTRNNSDNEKKPFTHSQQEPEKQHFTETFESNVRGKPVHNHA